MLSRQGGKTKRTYCRFDRVNDPSTPSLCFSTSAIIRIVRPLSLLLSIIKIPSARSRILFRSFSLLVFFFSRHERSRSHEK